MIQETLQEEILQAFDHEFGQMLSPEEITIQPTRREFEGSLTLVCFTLLKKSGMNPEQTATRLGNYLKVNSPVIRDFNVVKGFLNLVIDEAIWISILNKIFETPAFGFRQPTGTEVMIEYSSPNTNKPLHLGHLRNVFLGWSVAAILKANGTTVHKVQIINDRGIHICKSMVAWKRYGNGETPESSGKKGDKLVGEYYVLFDKTYKKEVTGLVAEGMTEEEAKKNAPIMQEAQEMLRQWEQRDPAAYALWERMNGWVYAGFDITYRTMGVDFDKLYYESQTYLLGKEEVMKGLEQGIFFQKEDGSVWVDLTAEGLDEKLLLRADGTSVYMTQDIGTAIMRFREFPGISRQIYTVGNEQEYHFKVLFLILDKLGYAWAKECYHLSYGMVDLPSGKMKSREGTVVDADDLMEEMFETACRHTTDLGKIQGFTGEQLNELYRMLGLGALKYFLLKVDPRKRMLFDPNESIQFQGNTAPFIQYTHARISAILRKANDEKITIGPASTSCTLQEVEQQLVQLLEQFPEKIREAGANYAPDVVAQYCFDLAKEYNRFYQEIAIFNETDKELLNMRLLLSQQVANVLKSGMGLMGIEMPERM